MSRRRMPGSCAMQIKTWAWLVKKAQSDAECSATYTSLVYLETSFMLSFSIIRVRGPKSHLATDAKAVSTMLYKTRGMSVHSAAPGVIPDAVAGPASNWSPDAKQP